MPSVDSMVWRAIRRKERGYVFTPHDLRSAGPPAAVTRALARLVRRRDIRRLGRGLYDFPRVSARLGILAPSLEAVAHALAREHGRRLQISGARAANALGLTTQVPAKLLYLTDGATRSRRVGTQVIDFKHAAPRTLRGAGTVAGTVLQALRYLGRTRVDDRVVRHLARTLSVRDKHSLRTIASAAPPWARAAIDDIVRGSSRA